MDGIFDEADVFGEVVIVLSVILYVSVAGVDYIEKCAVVKGQGVNFFDEI